MDKLKKLASNVTKKMSQKTVKPSNMKPGKDILHSFSGHCPVCDKPTLYISETHNLRSNLFCKNCRSIPRERAFAWCLNEFLPNWRKLVVHESSPAKRSISDMLERQCKHYIASQYFPGIAGGEFKDGVRCENLEELSFADDSIDLHCHLDVMEHVNMPGACFAEMQRTLKPGGKIIFTTPVYEGKLKTERRAQYGPDGIKYIAEPEYHGNPIDDQGALVTFHYGSDFANLIRAWAPQCSVTMITILDPQLGVLGQFREVFILTKYAKNILAGAK